MMRTTETAEKRQRAERASHLERKISELREKAESYPPHAPVRVGLLEKLGAYQREYEGLMRDLDASRGQSRLF